MEAGKKSDAAGDEWGSTLVELDSEAIVPVVQKQQQGFSFSGLIRAEL
jgi:hypothetical protein